MKRLNIILCFAALLFAAACKKDKSNYDLKPDEILTITGINPRYTVVSEKETLSIDPIISSNETNADFEYLWGIYETGVVNGIPKLDTIAVTKKLDYPVKIPAKGWTLVFRVKNKKTGYAKFFTSALSVITEFTRGWYVAKDDGTNADLDLFLTPNSIKPEGEKRENIYSQVNGSKLEGKVQLMDYVTSYRSTASGSPSPSATRTLFLSTDKEVAAIYINTLKTIRSFNSLFYQTPAVAAPQVAFIGYGDFFLINNGVLHGISTQSGNSGIFGAPILRDERNSPYRLSKYFIGSDYSNPYFFDENSSSFVSASGSATTITSITDDAGTSMPVNRNNKTLLYMGYKSNTYLPAPDYRFKVTGYAVFQDKTDPSVKILSEVATDGNKIKLVNDPLKSSDKMYNASMYTLLSENENIIYFTVGNQVWSRNLSSKSEILEYTAPAGEQITFIRHKTYSAGSDAAYAFNYFMIGTQSSGNYKVRMFNKSSGSLVSTPVFTLEGKGIARDVLYISPSRGTSNTSPTSF
uniref:PKD-like family lipoprotein n=1 Tax=Pedobacter schmidteae TaxID=2201271 RepID=UPI0013CEBDC7|nr:PKD-like family lipoprotein [Pedobacter schmidteae]